MKKIVLVMMALVFNMSLLSCTNDSVAETEALFDTQATDGDDNPIEPDPDAS